MEIKNMRETVVTFSVLAVTIASFALTIGLIIIVAIMHGLLHNKSDFQITLGSLLFFIVCFLIGIIVHEIMHIIGFRYAGKVPWNKIVWGIDWKKGVAYAQSKNVIKVKEMRIALMLPFFITGAIPFLLGIIFNVMFLSVLGAFLIGGCAGDFAYYIKLRKFPDEALVKDHPVKPQFFVYE
ncbi:DUF3267 domain-containing protein [Bacillus methanolicus]|uniref:Diaminopimelate epimerase n=1 Tax=Bacillus methanolicus (strain MGA3 / ATCC 53907) TaxID=796606 RepID=I3ECB5_BACMM|nr:DUF3267 domain-containing protein [Bacillus methanolicus]AIE61091.1 hypothetical protein BMMGA3_13505 [Bacillus methanolicus MGA3]EIJ84136.1 hypothetical protein MGA3_02555 [Bacillus methanolicus MGA3]